MADGWMEELRARVEGRLRTFLVEKREEARTLSPESVELVDAIDDLTMRGGKRLRPIVMAAGFHAVAPDGDEHLLDDPGASIELLQSYLLIHDDWMDRDDERRGGPSVYAMLRDAHRDQHLGASLTVLAGDLASAYASELFTAAEFPAARKARAFDVFWRLQREVFFGQQLDLVATPDVERMYDLKTGSYTVRGPLRIGALLGGASDEVIDVLDRFAAPLGIAFQIRDEVLGTFGDPGRTGKPAGNDLRAGKLTTLVACARERVPEPERAPLEEVLGRPDATDDEISAATKLLTDCGARAHVEQKLEALTEAATEALRDTPLQTERLATISRILTERDR